MQWKGRAGQGRAYGMAWYRKPGHARAWRGGAGQGMAEQRMAYESSSGAGQGQGRAGYLLVRWRMLQPIRPCFACYPPPPPPLWAVRFSRYSHAHGVHV